MILSRLATRPTLKTVVRTLHVRTFAAPSILITTKMSPPQPLIHYDSQTCPYAQRSWITLLEKELPFEVRLVDLTNKSEDFQAMYKTISPNPDAPAKVPILVDGATKLIESQIVVEYLTTKYRSAGVDLLPEDPADQAKAKLFIDTFTSAMVAPLFGLLRADTAEAVAAGKEKLVAGLKVIDACLRMHGNEEGGSYFFGGRFCIADVCTVPFLQRSLVAMSEYRGIDVWGLMEEQKLERLTRWAEAVLARPSAQETKPADDVMAASWKKFVVEVKG